MFKFMEILHFGA